MYIHTRLAIFCNPAIRSTKLDQDMFAKIFLLTVVTLVGAIPIEAGRMTTEGQSFQQMFDKADLVIIATAIGTKDTAERAKLLDTIEVIGVETGFKTRLVLKGSTGVVQFVLHHYREANADSVANGPALINIPPGRHPNFLMFLTKEKDGRYVPVTGQVDPALFSVIELKSGGIPEGPEGWAG